MSFYADLHLHSKYSLATSREGDLEHLDLWARRKGIALLGTGDFTHPAWRAEIRQKLVPAEPGLFRLKPEPPPEPGLARSPGPVRFALTVEVSTIYKRDGRTRKVHHLLLVPSLDAADRLTRGLARIGNVASDGRPILGLDSRDLLEMTLEAGPGSYLIPAHIWTPWFSALGSKSGFDSIEECYGELASEIFALETGLSSDPPMNWRLSALDRYRLVSNSDAHSPPKLGREANVFDCALDFFAVRRALATGAGFGGTLEFFPEEGKYHLDGHRKCGQRLTPEETRSHGGRCPQCGGPITVGVMHRVAALADRPEGFAPAGRPAFSSLIQLQEILTEINGGGGQAIDRAYDRLLRRLGPELWILEQALPDEIRRQGSEPLAEAIARMRRGQVIREAGYDGEYGTIRLFRPGELRRDKLLFELPAKELLPRSPSKRKIEEPRPERASVKPRRGRPPKKAR